MKNSMNVPKKNGARTPRPSWLLSIVLIACFLCAPPLRAADDQPAGATGPTATAAPAKVAAPPTGKAAPATSSGDGTVKPAPPVGEVAAPAPAVGQPAASDTGTTHAYRITDVTSEILETGLRIRIAGTQEPAYTVYEMFNPSRVVLDVASTVEYQQKVEAAVNNFATIKNSFISENKQNEPSLSRFEFTLKGTQPYTVNIEGNDLVVLIGSAKAAVAAGAAADTPAGGAASSLYDVDVQTSPEKTVIVLQADGPIKDFIHDVLPKDDKAKLPPRLYVDLNNIEGKKLLREQQVGTSLARLRVAERGTGLRIVLDSSMDTMFAYEIVPGKDRLEIIIPETGANAAPPATGATPSDTAIVSKVNEIETDGGVAEVQSGKEKQDNFNFAGYTRDRITVDFYKIDIHNVFRLFREISGMNIVIDEGVSGTLTLSLEDVPWDFALDIILNLKELQKEERFNTIVITNKAKDFTWPTGTDDNLSFEADEGLAMTEAIVIQQKMNIPPEQVAAKEMARVGREHEKREEFEDAVKQYEEALQNWPKDDVLASRIASIYLVQLRQNAKAVYYAQKALAANKNNYGAALNAAIGLANMKRVREAGQYFDQSVSGDKPAPEALLSYAVFCEENRRYDAAVKLLERHDTLHGENLNSMISAARIYDKQGLGAKALAKYKAILLAGFQVPPDLQKYIRGRVAMGESISK